MTSISIYLPLASISMYQPIASISMYQPIASISMYIPMTSISMYLPMTLISGTYLWLQSQCTYLWLRPFPVEFDFRIFWGKLLPCFLSTFSRVPIRRSIRCGWSGGQRTWPIRSASTRPTKFFRWKEKAGCGSSRGSGTNIVKHFFVMTKWICKTPLFETLYPVTMHFVPTNEE